MNTNAIMLLHPYRHGGQWVFDDPDHDLVKEPFVSGADRIIDRMVEQIPGAEDGFALLFSSAPFPGHDLELAWQGAEYNGNWYHSPRLDLAGWLCPALFAYFETAPERIYAQFKPGAGAPAGDYA